MKRTDTPRPPFLNSSRSASSRSTSIGLLSRFKREGYCCTRCGQVTPKNEARISGYDSESSLRHIHCVNCGKIVAWSSEGSRLNGILEGTCFVVAGVALASLLYPFLSIYGLQAGLFASMYGFLKISVL